MEVAEHGFCLHPALGQMVVVDPAGANWVEMSHHQMQGLPRGPLLPERSPMRDLEVSPPEREYPALSPNKGA
jgi:hypothetical protein